MTDGWVEFLKIERSNHFGITPAFRMFGEIANKVLTNIGFNKITNAVFYLPVTDLRNVDYSFNYLDHHTVFVEGKLGKQKVFEFTLCKDENILKRLDYSQEDWAKGKYSDFENLEDILPQKNNLVMIDKILYLDDKKIIAKRKVCALDFEDKDSFNLFRQIEMVGQNASFYLLYEINKGQIKQKAATFKKIDAIFYPLADKVVIGEELIIKLYRIGDEQEKKAYGEVRRLDGEILSECHFTYNEPVLVSKISRMAELVQKKADRKKK